MNARLPLLAVALALSACGDGKPYVPSTQPDQCLRPELFRACLSALPAGPQATQYNDWDEVVEKCEQSSYYQSMRRIETINPECRAQ